MEKPQAGPVGTCDNPILQMMNGPWPLLEALAAGVKGSRHQWGSSGSLWQRRLDALRPAALGYLERVWTEWGLHDGPSPSRAVRWALHSSVPPTCCPTWCPSRWAPRCVRLDPFMPIAAWVWASHWFPAPPTPASSHLLEPSAVMEPFNPKLGFIRGTLPVASCAHRPPLETGE